MSQLVFVSTQLKHLPDIEEGIVKLRAASFPHPFLVEFCQCFGKINRWLQEVFPIELPCQVKLLGPKASSSEKGAGVSMIASAVVLCRGKWAPLIWLMCCHVMLHCLTK